MSHSAIIYWCLIHMSYSIYKNLNIQRTWSFPCISMLTPILLFWPLNSICFNPWTCDFHAGIPGSSWCKLSLMPPMEAYILPFSSLAVQDNLQLSLQPTLFLVSITEGLTIARWLGYTQWQDLGLMPNFWEWKIGLRVGRRCSSE